MTVDGPDRFRALAALGAGDFIHLDGSLESHLISVHDLLKSWGARETLCDAGLFHAVYGTAGFQDAMVSPDRRSEIAAIIGIEAERIAYLYCSCERSMVWPRIGPGPAVPFHDRFTDEWTMIRGEDLSTFCELTCANEIEIAGRDPAFVMRDGTYFHNLFEQWGAFLSEAARRAVATIFGSMDR